MTNRSPSRQGVVAARPNAGGGAATPSFGLPRDASAGIPSAPAPLRIGRAEFAWGTRTFVMGILNVTPDSFSGDGLLSGSTGAGPVAAALALGRRMVDDG